jgi:glycosyltransferase involved in cell wall biosynthesis
MKNQPLISIIMNCFNGEEFLKDSIESVISQTYQNWELIFYDNCSKDNSKKIFNSFDNKKFKYFKSKRKLKLYEARNLAFKKAKGRYISFIDVDDIWLKTKLTKQLELMKKTKTKFCYSNYYRLKSNKKQKAYSKKLPEGVIYDELLKDYCVGIITVLLERKLLINSHIKFNINYDIIGDYDLFLKLSKKIKFSCVQEPLATYRVHDNNMSFRKFSVYIKELKDWARHNEKLIEKKFFLYFKNNLKYKEIKYEIYKSNYANAFKKFIKFPLCINKFKLLILFFLPKKYCRI